VAWFLFRAEAELLGLRRELADGSWRPEGFDLLLIRDPKPRAIARAPVADRVVHTALVSLMEPVFAPSLMPADMACRPGLGPQRAVLALQAAMRRHRFALHLDIRAFFASVDLDILRGLLARRIRDDAFLVVLDHVLDAGAGLVDRPAVREWLGLDPGWPPRGGGLPVGASTSQFLAAHAYLLELDHHIKRQLRVPGYLRYVDDLFLFGDRRADLRRWRSELQGWLWGERRLRLKHPRARILSCGGTLDALGHRLTRHDLRTGRNATRRLALRVRASATSCAGRTSGAAEARSLSTAASLLVP